MKVIDLEQNSAPWFDWRLKGIGSSDSPIIMGHSEYMGPGQLYNIKMQRTVYDTKSNYIQSMGHKFEIKARDLVNGQYRKGFNALCCEHDSLSYIQASLDGYSKGEAIETKLVSKAYYYETLRTKKTKFAHYIQMQHQMYVTGLDSMGYVTYILTDNKLSIAKLSVLKILRNNKFIKTEMLPAIQCFYESLKP